MKKLDLATELAHQVGRLDRLLWLTQQLRRFGMPVVVVGSGPSEYWLSVASFDRSAEAAVRVNKSGSRVTVEHMRGEHAQGNKPYGPVHPFDALMHCLFTLAFPYMIDKDEFESVMCPVRARLDSSGTPVLDATENPGAS